MLPKQYDFIFDDEHSWILYSGALAAGKTRALCYRAVRLALCHPAARVGLARKSMVSLKRTTLVTLTEADGEEGPVLPAGTYHYKKTAGEQEIQLNGGGKIIPFGCDNPESFGSLNLSDLCIDEGIELDKLEWNMLVGRCRVKLWLPYHPETKQRLKGDRLKLNTVAVATNPGAPTHFLYDVFYRKNFSFSRVIQTKTADNHFLPRKYIRVQSASLTGPHRLRFLNGVWCAMEGAVYPCFSPGTHIFHDPGPWDYIVVGLDWGFTHNTAIRVWGIRKKGKPLPRCHCLAEEYRKGATSPEVVDLIRTASRHYDFSRVVVDQNAPDLIKQLKNADIHAVPGRSGPGDVLPGIRCITAGLSSKDETGAPRISFEPGLKGTDEYMSYLWKTDSIKEEPIKRNDDALDADRYALVNVHDHANIKRILWVGDDSPKREDEDMFNVVEGPDPMLDPAFWGQTG